MIGGSAYGPPRLIRDWWPCKELSEKFRLRGADAGHLAAATRLGADFFVSNDSAFPYEQEVEKLKVIRLRPVWDLSLFYPG